MDLFIARQPILNAHKKLHGYELLYRGTKDAALDDVSGERATTALLSSVFLTKDIQELSNYRPCFINFTQHLIEQNLPASFPKSQIVVELLEDIEPTEKVVAVCKCLHNKGYKLALDDFIFHRKYLPLLEYIDIIKIDVRLTPLDSIVKTLNLLEPYNVKLLAEKVESREEYEKGLKLGFSYFQGYFFSRPEEIRVTELTASKVNMLQLLTEVTRKKTTLNRLNEIISIDVAISYKLLRFLNSAYFYRLQEVKTVKHAIAYLGERELRRFILLIIISELATEFPGELVRLVLVRAKLCELLALSSIYVEKADELFILGLFSSLDTMLKTSMEQVMKELPVSSAIREALLNKTGVMYRFLHTAMAFERNDKDVLQENIRILKINPRDLSNCYMSAVKYANGLM